MIKIPLTQGKYALIDDCDFTIVSPYKWYAVKDKNIFYAATNIGLGNKQTQLKMHRLIMDAKKGEQTDHKDRDGLNNQRSNLRKCTNSQNHMNRRSHKGSSSQYKGVSWFKRTKKWMVRIKFKSKVLYLGLFKNEINAAKKYNEFAVKLFGEYAHLNLLLDDKKYCKAREGKKCPHQTGMPF